MISMVGHDSAFFTIGSVLIFIAAPPATLFPVLYAMWFPFWKNTLGRALMTKAVGIAMLIDLAVLYILFGDDYALREAARVITYGFMSLGLWWQLWSIVKIRLEDRRCQRSREGYEDNADAETFRHGAEQTDDAL